LVDSGACSCGRKFCEMLINIFFFRRFFPNPLLILQELIFSLMETTIIKKRFFHACSNGRLTGEIFHTVEDYIESSNRLALCAAHWNGKVRVIAYCLMPTHIHFLLFGSAKECASFITDYEDMTIRHIRKTNLGWKHDELYLELREVTPGDGVKSECAYILRNPTQAGMPYLPWEYPWSSGSLFFMPSDWERKVFDNELLSTDDDRVKTIGELSQRAKYRLFHTKECSLPSEWTMHKGIVLPSNYVISSDNLAGYNSKKDFLYYVGKIRDDKVIDDCFDSCTNISQGIQGLKVIASRLFISKYSHSNYKRVRDLPVEYKQEMARMIFQQTHSSIWMLAKAVCLRFDETIEAIYG